MFIRKMYKLEKIVHFYKSNDITNDSEQALYICDLANVRISSIEELDYIKGAIAIPYTEMLKHIHFYHNHMMDEGEELFWIDGLGKQYGLPANIVVKRFHNVSKLSSSLIYKKRLEELFGIDYNLFNKGNQGNEKKLVLSKISKKQ